MTRVPKDNLFSFSQNQYKDPSLNIIATLLLTKKVIKYNNKLLKNVICNIYYLTDGELGIFKNVDHIELNENNFYTVLLRMYAFGFNKLNINIISKDIYVVDERKIDITEFSMNFGIKNSENKYIIKYLNPSVLLNKNNIMNNIGLLNNDIPNIFIFKNMSWFEVVTFFRKGDIIISGGNVVQRHILTNERVLLSFFINSIKNINIVDKLDNKLSSNLLNLFKHNNKNIIKYLKSNYDWTVNKSTILINDIIQNSLNEYSVSNELKNEINIFLKNGKFLNILKKYLNDNTSDFDILLFIKYLYNEYNYLNNKENNYYVEIYKFIKSLLDNNDDNEKIKDYIRNEINNLVLELRKEENNYKKKKNKDK